jgi:hypothetical protein
MKRHGKDMALRIPAGIDAARPKGETGLTTM